MTHPYQSACLDWCGIAIEVCYCPSWSESYEEIYGYPLAHLTVEAVTPANVPLPISETGYRSYFTRPDLIEAEGGPVAFVRAWLDHEAQSDEWKQQQEKSRQLTLF